MLKPILIDRDVTRFGSTEELWCEDYVAPGGRVHRVLETVPVWAGVRGKPSVKVVAGCRYWGTYRGL